MTPDPHSALGRQAIAIMRHRACDIAGLTTEQRDAILRRTIEL